MMRTIMTVKEAADDGKAEDDGEAVEDGEAKYDSDALRRIKVPGNGSCLFLRQC